MTLINKYSMKQFDAPICVLSLQMIGTAACVSCTRQLQFGTQWRRWMMKIPPLILMMLLSSFCALRYVTLGTFVVVRNMMPCFTMWLEYMINAKVPSLWQCFSVAMILAGALVYEFKNIHFSGLGVILLLVNLVVSCLDRVFEKRLLESLTDTNMLAMTFMNNMPGLPMLLAELLFRHGTVVAIAQACAREKFAFFLILSGVVVGTSLNMLGMTVQKRISATAMMVLGSLNKTLIILWGMLMMGDDDSAPCILGACLSMLGCIFYSLPQHATDHEQPLLEDDA